MTIKQGPLVIVTNPGFDIHRRRCWRGKRKGSERKKKKKSEERDGLLGILAAGEVEGESVFDPVGSKSIQVQALATLADHVDGPRQIGFLDWGQIESDNG